MTARQSAGGNAGILRERGARIVSLQDACVDIWKVPLAGSEADLVQAHGLLSPDEKQRADRIGSLPMQRTFTSARAALRCLLGHYLDCSPETVGFEYEPGGKPRLRGHAGICFSSTHSGIVAAFAFCTNSPVGIDVERLRTISNMDRVIERMFSPGEKRQISLLAPELQQRAFFACWTRQEAYAKATGEGILAPFDQFSVDLNPEESNPEIQFDGVLTNGEWVLHDLRLGDEYASALAYRGAKRHHSIFDAGSLSQLLSINGARPPAFAAQSS